ncbi:response regulator transcription factor [Aromatoleum toluclasticum]|uniref:response regulator transcription factor n=1 Tax=Aromatoleum toluclasticum TaxID=92003 RepID=UPI00037E7820|nr:response regulator transcription factor [Aromatoleum toluclasticum]MCC4115608.1 response regulator transcription factor [Aromatoleum toluclasticum]
MTGQETSSPLILVLEDEPDIARIICSALSGYGFRSEHLRTGRELLARAHQTSPDLVIVDLGLPDMDGMQVVRELQDGSPCAVLILTGRNDLTDRVLGLELGADDYIVKPFEPRELVARVRSILRRYTRAAAPDAPGDAAPPERTVARFGNWQFDTGRHSLVHTDGSETSLSSAEAALLLTLVRRPNKILSREQLLGERDVDPFDRSIDVRISRLRRKLGDDPHSPKLIKTVYGAGYLFAAQVGWE